MSSTSFWDIISRSRPYSTDVEARDDLLGRGILSTLRMLADAEFHIPGQIVNGTRPTCQGLQVGAAGAACTISAGSAVTARPASFGPAGALDDPNLVLVENFSAIPVVLGAAGWYMIGARPVVVVGSPVSLDVFNTVSGDFQAQNIPQNYRYGITGYIVAGTPAAWPSVASWVSAAGDIPLALVNWNGATVTQVVDLRVTPGDMNSGMALNWEGETTYESDGSFPSSLIVSNRNALVQGQYAYANGQVITIATISRYLDQINASSPLIPRQIYWVYLCGVGGYLPRDAYAQITASQATTRGLIVLSRAQPQIATLASTPETGPTARVNSTNIQLPVEFGGDIVPAGGATCIGFVQIGDTAATFRPIWSEGPNNHRLGQALPPGVIPNAGSNWEGYVPSIAGTGVDSIIVPIQASHVGGITVDPAIARCQSLLLDVRLAGNPALPTDFQITDQNQVANANAGDLMFQRPAMPAGNVIYLRGRLPAGRANPTTVKIWANALLLATHVAGAEILGYSW